EQISYISRGCVLHRQRVSISEIEDGVGSVDGDAVQDIGEAGEIKRGEIDDIAIAPCARPVGNRVIAEARREYERIIATAAGKNIVAGTPGHPIIARGADQHVSPGCA